MESIWKKEIEIADGKSLEGDMKVHTLIIGAGMAGILTAYLLKKRGIEAVIVEAKTIASGQTENTTAKITSQHGLFYSKLLRKAGVKRAKAYAKANEEAIRIYEQIVRKENIDCDFEKKPSYLYTVTQKGIKELDKEAEIARMLGIKASYVDGEQITELPFTVKGAVCFENQAQFHPLKFIKHLVAQLTIYENTKVLSVKEHMVYTNTGTIWAENIVFACHYPIINVPGFYFLRQHQERSYVLALETGKELSGMYYSIDEDGLSFRSVGEVLLLGGGSHRTGKCICHCSDVNKEKYGYTFLQKMADKYYKDTREVARWAAQDCMPHDEIPFIGKYSIFRPYWYVASGFKKWGMTSSMVSAMLITSHLCGKYSTYEDAFSPQRLLLRMGISNFIKDVGESIKGLSKGLFADKKRRCKHMGCKLEWNNEEDSWDCPCHGSRYDKNGELLDNPAQIDLDN